MKRLMVNYLTGNVEEYDVVRATLVKLWNCSRCGIPFLREDLPLGTIYRVVLGTEYRAFAKCAGCGKASTPTFILVEEGDAGIYKGLPLEILRFEKEVANDPH